LLRIYQRQV